MNTYEFETILRKTLATHEEPRRENFVHLLQKLEDSPVTKSPRMRYTGYRSLSNSIISNSANIVTFWKSRRMVLIPSLILVVFVGTFSLSSRKEPYDTLIPTLVELNEAIEEPGIDLEDSISIAFNDTPAIDDLATLTNEF